MSCSRPDGRRLRRLGVVAALIAAAIWPVACQEPPKPFQSLDPARDQPLSVPAIATGVLVRAVAGAPKPAAFADAMAAALTRRDIPATTGPANLRSWLLIGAVTAAPARGAGALVDLSLRWDLADATGRARAQVDRAARVAAKDWAAAAPALLQRLADDAAGELATKFIDDNAPGVTRQPLTVHSVTGAPGDGNVSLRRALESALGRRGFRMNRDIVDGGIVITGTVRVVPGGREGDRVSIQWTALAPDGATLGTVDQDNRVPTGSLAGAWGIAAVQVAEAAAPGIAQLLARAKTGVAKSPP